MLKGVSSLNSDDIVNKVKLEQKADKKKEKIYRLLIRFIFLSSLIFIWHLVVNTNIFEQVLFPSPKEVVLTLWAGFYDGSFYIAVIASLKRLLIGYVISLIIGIPLGLGMGRVNWLNDTIGMFVLGLQALPSICWLPLAVLWFGLNEMAIQFVVIMGSLLSITLSVRDGVKSIPPIYLKAAQVLGATKIKLYTHVLIPASLPSVITGAKLGWTFAWRALMAAELIYISNGIGSILAMGRELHDMAIMVSAMVIIIIIGLFFDKLVFSTLEEYVHVRWGG